MARLPTSLLAVLVVVAVTGQAKASDLRMDLPALRLTVLPSALAVSALTASLVLAGADPLRSASSATALSLTSRTLALQSAEADRHVRGKITGAGYGLAAGLGTIVGGVVMAAQTRPNNWKFSSGVCYDSKNGEKKFLYAASGVMAAGLAVSSGMLAWLVGLRRAHPDVQPSRRTRGLQALVGIAAAGVSTTVLMSYAIPCASS